MMGAVMLRAERCLFCGWPMPAGLRIDARYCKPSCRTLAYRMRRRTYGPANQSARHTPKWAAGQTPVIGSALALLASIQAQILQLALLLEQQDIAIRHPPRADAADPASAAVGSAHEQLAATVSEDAATLPLWQQQSVSLGQVQAAITAASEEVVCSASKLDELRAPVQHLPAIEVTTEWPSERAVGGAQDLQPMCLVDHALPTNPANHHIWPALSTKNIGFSEDAAFANHLTERVEESLEAGAAFEDRPMAETSATVRRADSMDTPRRAKAQEPDFQRLSHGDELLPTEARTREPQMPDYVEQLQVADAQSNGSQALSHVDRLLQAQTHALQPHAPDYVKSLLDPESSAKKPLRGTFKPFQPDTSPEASRKAAPPAAKQQLHLPTRTPQPRASAQHPGVTAAPLYSQSQQVSQRPAPRPAAPDQAPRIPAQPSNVRTPMASSTKSPTNECAGSQTKPGPVNQAGDQPLRGSGDPGMNQGDPERGHEKPRDYVGELLLKGNLKDSVGRILRQSGVYEDAPDYVSQLFGKGSGDEP